MRVSVLMEDLDEQKYETTMNPNPPWILHTEIKICFFISKSDSESRLQCVSAGEDVGGGGLVC